MVGGDGIGGGEDGVFGRGEHTGLVALDPDGIDLLEVEAESAGDQNSTDRIKVTVGKDLSERMAVRYSVESKDGGYVHRAATEYRLLEHFIVSGFQDTKGTYGAEFIFRVRFRLFRLN